jgi:hypothetical protein
MKKPFGLINFSSLSGTLNAKEESIVVQHRCPITEIRPSLGGHGSSTDSFAPLKAHIPKHFLDRLLQLACAPWQKG